MPIAAEELISELVGQQWGTRLVRGWGEHWIDMPQRLGKQDRQDRRGQ